MGVGEGGRVRVRGRKGKSGEMGRGGEGEVWRGGDRERGRGEIGVGEGREGEGGR